MEKTLYDTIKEEKGFVPTTLKALIYLLWEGRPAYNITLYKSFENSAVIVNLSRGHLTWNENRCGFIIEHASKTYINLNLTEDVTAGVYNKDTIHLETEEGFYAVFRLKPV